MKLIDKAKQAAMEGAVTKALEYLEKDPETNIPKLMELHASGLVKSTSPIPACHISHCQTLPLSFIRR